MVGLTVASDETQPQFEVLLGNGAGGFASTVFSPAISFPNGDEVPTTWIAAGDLNKDGFMDFVVTANTEQFFVPYLNQSGKNFVLGNAGNRTNVLEASGRNVAYVYDNDYRLKSETITSDPGS